MSSEDWIDVEMALDKLFDRRVKLLDGWHRVRAMLNAKMELTKESFEIVEEGEVTTISLKSTL